MRKKIEIKNKRTCGYTLSDDALIHLQKLKMALGVSMSIIVELALMNTTSEKIKTQYLAMVQDRMREVKDINPVIEIKKEILTPKQKYNRVYYAKHRVKNEDEFDPMPMKSTKPNKKKK